VNTRTHTRTLNTCNLYLTLPSLWTVTDLGTDRPFPQLPRTPFMQHIISQTRNATIIDHNNVTPQSRKSSPPTHRPDSLPTPIHELLSQLEAQAGNAQPSDSQPICEYGLFLRGLQSTGSFPTNYFMLILVGFRGRGRG
jgi:hypothetical protein